jgi:hypothetical protein
MASLREIEKALISAVLYGDADRVGPEIVAGALPAARRLAIYRNNARATHASVLAATYPVLERLAGADWLRQTGREYMERYPSRRGDLHEVGRQFGDFLERRLSGTRHGYFADVARLEWAYQDVLVAADQAPLDPARLESVDADEHPRLVFALAPAVRLVAAPYPILAIWRANRADVESEGVTQPIDLDAGPSRVLIARRRDHVELRELPPDEFLLLGACDRGLTLEQIAGELAQPLELPALLARAVSMQLIVDFHLAPAPAGGQTSHGDFS